MENIFTGKKIVVGVTGSIAAFKVAGWVSKLAKNEAFVFVIITKSGRKFVTPLTFAALSGQRVYTEMFEKYSDEPMAHINLGAEADLILIAPATANTIAKLANGYADNLLGATVLAARAPVFICPAMNSQMYAHGATQDNIKILKELGYYIIDPASGTMACKDVGEGRLAEWDVVKQYLARALSRNDLEGKRVLVSAGPTREDIDPARFLSNRSSGKMGYALAKTAFRRGAWVTLVSGPTSLPHPAGVDILHVESADEMFDAMLAHAEKNDIIVKAAAVADFRPEKRVEHKVKKESVNAQLKLVANRDILLTLGKKKRVGQLLVGFAAESRNLQAEGMKKLKKKNLDFIAVNSIAGKNTGFEVDNNQVLLLSEEGAQQLPFTSKIHTADLIWDAVVQRVNNIA